MMIIDQLQIHDNETSRFNDRLLTSITGRGGGGGGYFCVQFIITLGNEFKVRHVFKLASDLSFEYGRTVARVRKKYDCFAVYFQ